MKKIKTLLFTALLTTLILMISSCATTLNVRVQRPSELDMNNYPIIENSESLTRFGKLLIMRLSNLLYKEFEGFIISQEYKQNFVNAIARNNSNDKIFKNFLLKLSSASFYYKNKINEKEKTFQSNDILYDLMDRYFYKDILIIIENTKKDIYLNKKEIKVFINTMNKICNGININTYLESIARYSNASRIECNIKYDGDKIYKISRFNLDSLYYGCEILIEEYLFDLFGLNSKDYKNDNGYLISFIGFISTLEKNEPAKYEKINNYIVEKIKTMEFGKLCLEKGYNLSLADKNNYINAFSKYELGWFTKANSYDVKIKDYNYLAYPMADVPKCVLEEGKKISDEMLSNYFSTNDLQRAKDLFYNPNTIINIYDNKEVEINSCILSAFDKRTLDFVPDYDSYENKYNRLYIACYLYKNGSSQYKTMLWERIYSFILRPLAAKYNLHSIFEKESEKHQEVLDILFKSLNRFGIKTSNVSEEFKNNCLISLMDYSYSTLKQDSMFPVLEQIGDAIFDVVVTNLLYLDPRIRAKNCDNGTNCMNEIDSLKKKYCSADEQTNIAIELKLNEIYLVSNLDAKKTIRKEKNEFTYIDYDAYHAKYFADSYEMIIGTIYNEFGLDVAYKFAEDTFLTVFPNFKVVKELSSLLDKSGNNIEKVQNKLSEICSEYELYQFLSEAGSYLLTVKPDFRIKFRDEYYLGNLSYNYGDLNYRILEVSLMKLACIIIFGNSTKEQRIKLNLNFYNIKSKNHEFSINSIAVYEFLNNGITAMIDSVKNNSEINIS